MIRQLIEFLYKRYPPRLVVTRMDYTQLREELGQLNVAVQGIIAVELRLQAVEKQIRTLNDAQGFVTQGKTSFRLER